MEEIVAFMLILALILALVIGVDWILWHAWMSAVGYFWTAAPEHVARPDFWMFVLAVCVLGWSGQIVFGSRNDES